MWFGGAAGAVGAALLLAVSPTTVSPTAVSPTAVSPTAASPSAVSDSFPLRPASDRAGAAGRVVLRRVWSPFGVTVSRDGSLVWDAVVTAHGLTPAPEGAAYVVWLATPELDRVQRAGDIDNASAVTARVSWNQFLVIVTLESGRPGARWAGPTVLLGRSRSALIAPLWGHSLFQRTPF